MEILRASRVEIKNTSFIFVTNLSEDGTCARVCACSGMLTHAIRRCKSCYSPGEKTKTLFTADG